MASSTVSSKNKRKAVVQNGASNKKKKTASEKIHTGISQNEECVKNEVHFQAEMLKIFEEELKCNICTEFLIKATVLNCSHTFCELCIEKWKRQRQQCPICRERISTQVRILSLDVFIEKALELLSAPEQAKARKKVVNQREQYSSLKPRRSQRLKNKRTHVSVTTTTTTTTHGEENNFHLRALIDEVLHLANQFSSA